MNQIPHKQKVKSYVLEIRDSAGYKHYPIEGADGIGKTTIERSDSPAMYKGYQLEYVNRRSAERAIHRVKILAEAKAECSTMPDRPILPLEVKIVGVRRGA